MEWCGVKEGGRGSRAHSPELVVTHVLIIAHVLVITCVLTAAHVLIITCVHSWVLAVLHEPWWPFWLVVGRMHRGLWAMVKRVRWWVVFAACGQWMVVGDHSQVVVVVVAYVLPWALGIIRGLWWLVVVIFGWGGGVVSGPWWLFL